MTESKLTPLVRARLPNQKLTHDELAYIRTHYPNHPTADIATRLGVTPRVVTNRARLMGLKKSQEYRNSRYTRHRREIRDE